MTDMIPIVVDFPLRGEWAAATTPAHKIPSHGTHIFAQMYAYDFVRLDGTRDGIHFHTKGMLEYLMGHVSLEDCPSWAQPIFAPFDALVVEVKDGIPERVNLSLIRDTFVVLKNAVDFKISDYLRYTGNFIVLKGKDAFAALAHIRCGSIRVRAGERVTAGQLLAEVGHSGNSTAPHLHFQLMDSPDMRKAKGIPCCFLEYEVYENGRWRKIANGVPKRWERIRAL